MGSANEAAGPQYGRRLIPNVIDQLSRDEPDREAFQIPRSQNPQDGWTSVTFRQYADAISLQAHEIVKCCGRAPDGAFPTLAYIGPQDARYVVFLVSAVKAGYQVSVVSPPAPSVGDYQRARKRLTQQALFVSTRNAAGGQVSLFAETGCHVLFCDGSYKPAADAWRQEREMAVVQVKPCEAWFGGADVQHFPYDKTFDEAEWDPLCVLHTSGSTGHPKPVIVRNMPLFHAAALYVYIISVIWWKTPVALGLGDRALTADLATECLRYLEVESAALPPSVLEEMSQDSQGLDALRKLKMIPIGGVVGLRKLTRFTPFPLYFQTRPELWQYFVINSDLFGCDWRAAGGNVYELVVVRKDKHPGLQGFFYTFPDLDEVSTHDLFEPHPTLSNYWKYRGRADHIIVFSNGEKLNPVTMEGIVQAHPAVKGALVVAGASRFQPGLLIEPITQPCGESEERALIEELWPQVVRANRETVAHGQVAKAFIAVTAPGKAFCRAGKGTVQRAATLAAHAQEIEQLYERAERVLPSEGPLPFLGRDPTALGRWIVKVLMPHVRGVRVERTCTTTPTFSRQAWIPSRC
ncbi:Non-canonical non-ribosomal peptide synthetase FUB8 [Apiospora saccharicola]